MCPVSRPHSPSWLPLLHLLFCGIISLMFALKLLFVSLVEVLFVFCTHKAACIITLLSRPIMKSQMPPNMSLPPIKLLQKPVYLLWSCPFLVLIPDCASGKHLNVILNNHHLQINFLGKSHVDGEDCPHGLYFLYFLCCICPFISEFSLFIFLPNKAKLLSPFPYKLVSLTLSQNERVSN